jgi:hypothetical protein
VSRRRLGLFLVFGLSGGWGRGLAFGVCGKLGFFLGQEPQQNVAAGRVFLLGQQPLVVFDVEA